MYLTTFAGLCAACYLYEQHGFTLCGEADCEYLTGKAPLTKQIFEYLVEEK